MQAAQKTGYEVGTVMYMAIELSNRSWKLGFSNGKKHRCKTIEARNGERLFEEVARARSKLGLAEDARVVCCFEAGRDGHWLYRWLGV